VAPLSVLSLAGFYLAPLDNAAFLVLALCCAAGIWINGRIRPAIGLLIASLALYLPYLVLPNHRLEYYQWAPMPLLVLLVPLAWTPKTGVAGEPEVEAGTPRIRLITRTAIVAALIFAIVGLGAAEYSPFSNWALGEQNYNRSAMAAARTLKPALRGADSVLVVGVSNVFHPWHHAELLSRELGFTGTWYVAAGPADRPIDPQPHARPIPYDQIHWSDYDEVVVFTDDGRLVGSYRGDEVEALAKRSGWSRMSNRDVVAALQGRTAQPVVPVAQSSASDTTVTVPRGLSSAAEQQPGSQEPNGLYASTSRDGASCCWIAPEAVLPVLVDAGTRDLDIRVYLPSYQPFQRQGQSITISAPETGTSTHTVPLGNSDVIVHLVHPVSKAGVVRLHVRSAAVLVPSALGINGDQRRLALIVRSVEARR
jgi:hypothetical protein